MRVLLVEDEMDIRFIARLMLEEYHELTEAESGAEALEQLDRSIPDAILLDIRLPDTEGWELLDTIHGDPRYTHIPIVMLSAHSSQSRLVEALDRGACAYLTKPFKEAQLLAALESAFAS